MSCAKRKCKTLKGNIKCKIYISNQNKSGLCRSCHAIRNWNKVNNEVKLGIRDNAFKNKKHSRKVKNILSEKAKLNAKKEGYINPAKRIEVRKKISDSKFEFNYIKGKTWNEYFGNRKANKLKRATRIRQQNRIIDNILHPTFYNKKSISLIESYGKDNGYNFKHAENGGEFPIIGYWLDGYDKEKNVVIEFYERAHYKLDGSLNEKTLNREKEIIEELNPTFIRIHAFDINKINIEKIN